VTLADDLKTWRLRWNSGKHPIPSRSSCRVVEKLI
jgi:hypothetical protein